MQRAVEMTKVQLNIKVIENPGQYRQEEGVLNLIDMANLSLEDFKIGTINATCGRAAYQYIEKSVELAQMGLVDAIATAPINKESLKAAAVPYIGHTEILAALAMVADPLTMFEVDSLRVFFLSRHVSLRQACDLVTKDNLLKTARRCFTALETLGIPSGRLAIAGLNPHSGENGLFGREEVEEIVPAVLQLRQEGYDVVGPVSADSVFTLALKGKYQAVLSLYHDQGHIATKTYDFNKTIAITNGLPFLRTSVDHGTAFDLAGSGLANEISIVEAIKLAAKYAPHFTDV